MLLLLVLVSVTTCSPLSSPPATIVSDTLHHHPPSGDESDHSGIIAQDDSDGSRAAFSTTISLSSSDDRRVQPRHLVNTAANRHQVDALTEPMKQVHRNFTELQDHQITTSSNAPVDSSQVKVTHQVSHVVFEVSEFGPFGSTLPAPTLALKPTKPVSSYTMTPVFIPKISVDGRPLPLESNKYAMKAGDDSPIPTEPPRTGILKPTLRVVSHYSSTSIDSPLESAGTDSSTNIEDVVPIGDEHEYENNKSISPDETNLSKELLSTVVQDRTITTEDTRRKEQLHTYLFKESQISEENSKIASAIDLRGDEIAIESLVPFRKITSIGNIKDKSSEGNTSTSKFPSTTVPTKTTLAASQETQTTLASVAPPIIVKEFEKSQNTKSQILYDKHDNTFKREIIEDSPDDFKEKHAAPLYEDYEKEDGDLFASEGLRRDPRIYLNREGNLDEVEKKKLKSSKYKSFQPITVTSKKDVDLPIIIEHFSDDTEASTVVGQEQKVLPSPSSTEQPITTSISGVHFIVSDLSDNDKNDEEESDTPPYIEDENYPDLTPPKSNIELGLRQLPDTNMTDSLFTITDNDGLDRNNSVDKFSYDEEPPSAAAVAEAAIFTDISADRSKSSR